MNVFKRMLNGIFTVGAYVAVWMGLMIAVSVFTGGDYSTLFRIIFGALVVLGFVQGYLSGGDGNSEAKSAD